MIRVKQEQHPQVRTSGGGPRRVVVPTFERPQPKPTAPSSWYVNSAAEEKFWPSPAEPKAAPDPVPNPLSVTWYRPSSKPSPIPVPASPARVFQHQAGEFSDDSSYEDFHEDEASQSSQMHCMPPPGDSSQPAGPPTVSSTMPTLEYKDSLWSCH